jgi:dihydrofolate synthase/folylpolyglutamate synthase
VNDNAHAEFTRLFGPEFGHGKSFDLARLRATLKVLGDPQDRLPPVIHVAGTNGKGSSIAFMRAIAEAAGLMVHAFTKPHLNQINERFVFAGREAEDEALIDMAECIAQIEPDLTQFDAQVATALALFADVPADLVLLETGMGGRDDSTNVIARPALTVLTPIALDHQEALGARLSDIAAHKVAILRPHVPCVIARQFLEARQTIEKHAEAIGAPLLWQGEAWDIYAQSGRMTLQMEDRALDLPTPALYGAHQIDNAGLAIAALLTWRPDFPEAAIAQGVQNTQWPGRLQPVRRGALKDLAGDAEVWIDGGHNAHAARALAAFLKQQDAKRPAETTIVLGMRARKDAKAFLEELKQTGAALYCVPLSEDGADPVQLAAAAAYLGIEAEASASLQDAITKARNSGASRILICGSLLLAGEALRLNQN